MSAYPKRFKNGRLLCSSPSKSRGGGPCAMYAIDGGSVCRIHGGAAPQVQRKAAERLEATEERVKLEYARLALFDVRNLYDENGKLLPLDSLDDNTAAAIASIEFGPKGRIDKIRFIDKKGALDSISKHLGLFKADKQEGELRPLHLRITFVDPPTEDQLKPPDESEPDSVEPDSDETEEEIEEEDS